MRLAYLLLVLCGVATACPAHAQLTGPQKEAAAKYFHSLPFGQYLDQWLATMAADTALVSEPIGLTDSQTLYRGHWKRPTLFPEADSSLLLVSRWYGNRHDTASDGRLFPVRTPMSYALMQRYFIPRSAMSREELDKRCRAIINELAAGSRARKTHSRASPFWRSYAIGRNEVISDIRVAYGDPLHHFPKSHWIVMLDLSFMVAPGE